MNYYNNGLATGSNGVATRAYNGVNHVQSLFHRLERVKYIEFLKLKNFIS